MPRMKKHSVGWVSHVLIFALLLGACGGNAPRVRPSSPFTEADARIFDDAADFFQDPDALEGRWRDEWTEEFNNRVGTADFIAAVSVSTVRTDVDLDRRRTFRLVVTVEQKFFGRVPGRDVTLAVSEGTPGFASIQAREQGLLDERFLLYAKWYRTPEGTVAAHWHLSPDTRPIRERTSFLVDRRRGVAQATVIVREN